MDVAKDRALLKHREKERRHCLAMPKFGAARAISCRAGV